MTALKTGLCICLANVNNILTGSDEPAGSRYKEGKNMKSILIQWIISAAGLLIVTHVLPGFVVDGIGAALLAAVVIGLINATIGLFLKIITIPLSILTFGIFLLVINALMLMLASSVVPGFHISGFWTAFFGALVLAIISMILRRLLGEN